MTELVKRAELVASEAKRIGFWDNEEASKFVNDIYHNIIDEEILRLYEEEIIHIVGILDGK